VKVTALLCDHAEVCGGKLFVNGAGVNLLGTPTTEPPHPINICLALIVTIPWTATNHQHRMTIELLSDPGGGAPVERIALAPRDPEQSVEDEGVILALFNAGRAAHMVVGEETLMPVALPLSLPLPRTGSYFFELGIDGTHLDRLSFRVVSPTQMAGIPGFQNGLTPGPGVS